MKKILLSVSILTLACNLSFAQKVIQNSTDELEVVGVGMQVPSEIWRKVPRKNTTRLVILDFWGTWCTVCMESFPHMKSLQEQFPEDLQIVLVNPIESEKKVAEKISKLNTGRVKHGMEPFVLPNQLPRITGDSIFNKVFFIRSFPHHVWLDSAGKVLYMTGSYNAIPQNVKAVLNGKQVNMLPKDDFAGEKISKKGYLQPTISDLPPVYYSAFIPYYSTISSGAYITDSVKQIFRVTEYNSDPMSLFRTAFIQDGMAERVIIEAKNSEQYKRPDYETQAYLVDDWIRKYVFTYEIQCPLQGKDRWREKMQDDVNQFFGQRFGIEGHLEKRKLSALILKQKDKKLIPVTNGGKWEYVNKDSLFIINNNLYRELVDVLRTQLEVMKIGRPFIDESGIDPDTKIDVKIVGSLKDLKNLRKQLQKYGLDIVRDEREVTVLVIGDKDDESGSSKNKL